MVPADIDPGFAYNPGTALLRAVADKASRSIELAAAADLSAARITVQDIIADTAFDQFLALPDLPFPVAVLNNADQALIGSQAASVRLSRQTLEKQANRHEDLSTDQYRILPTIIHSGTVEEESAGRLRYFWRDADGKWWRAAVKRTEDGRELFVVSLHRLNVKEGRRLDRKYGDGGDAR